MTILRRLFGIRGGSGREEFPSIVDALSRILSASDLKTLFISTPDRRRCVERAAELLAIDESSLITRLSEITGLPVLSRVTSFVSGDLEGVPSIEELRGAGAIPLIGNGTLTGVACVDPAQVKDLFPAAGPVPLFLAPWLSIQGALEESEKLKISRGGDPVEADLKTRGEKIAEELLGHLMHEVNRFGRSSITVSFGSEITYAFTTIEGRSAYGSVDNRMSTVLKKYLRDAARVGIVRMKIPGAEVAENVRCRMVKGDERFILEWGALATPISFQEEPHSGHDKVVPFPAKSTREDVSALEESESCDTLPFVLVVEDNETFSHVLHRFLSRHGVYTERASSGEDALERLRHGRRPDVVVCDLHMPGMDGARLLSTLRASSEWSSLPVIVLTSDDDVETEIRLVSGGADAFISKSEDPRVLCAHVKRVIERGVARRAA